MEKTRFSLLGFICVISLNEARADIFRCTNAEGKVITSDRPIPECINRGMKVYSNSGRFKSNIAPPLSAEEKQKNAAEAEKKRREQIEEQEQKKEERYFLAHYQSEADVEAARQRVVDSLTEKKRLANEQLESLSQLILRLQEELKASKKTTREFESIRQRADDLSNNVSNTRKSIAFYDQEIARTNREYEEILQRYRTIVSRNRR
jgi:chromosome segregation ATPase